jgi:hypothetical protein
MGLRDSAINLGFCDLEIERRNRHIRSCIGVELPL